MFFYAPSTCDVTEVGNDRSGLEVDRIAYDDNAGSPKADNVSDPWCRSGDCVRAMSTLECTNQL